MSKKFERDDLNEDGTIKAINFQFSLITLSLASRFLNSLTLKSKITIYTLSRAAQFVFNYFVPYKKKDNHYKMNLALLGCSYSSLILVDYFSSFRMLNLGWQELGLAIGVDWISLFIVTELADFLRTYPEKRNVDIKKILNQNLNLTWLESKTGALIFKFNEQSLLDNLIVQALEKNISQIFNANSFKKNGNYVKIKTYWYQLSLNYSKRVKKLTAQLSMDIYKIKNCVELNEARLADLNKAASIPWQAKYLISDHTVTAHFTNESKCSADILLERFPFICFSTWIEDREIPYATILFPKINDEEPACGIDILFFYRNAYKDILISVIVKVINFLAALLFFVSPSSPLNFSISALIPQFCSIAIYIMEYHFSCSLRKIDIFTKKNYLSLFIELLSIGGLLLSWALCNKTKLITLFLSSINSFLCSYFCAVYPFELKRLWRLSYHIKKMEKIVDLLYHFFPNYYKNIKLSDETEFSTLKFIFSNSINQSEEYKLLLRVINKLLPLFVPGTKTHYLVNDKLILQFNKEISSICKEPNFLHMLITKTQYAYILADKLTKINPNISDTIWSFDLSRSSNPKLDCGVRILINVNDIRNRFRHKLKDNFNALIVNGGIYLSMPDEILSKVNSSKNSNLASAGGNNLGGDRNENKNNPLYSETKARYYEEKNQEFKKINWHQHQYSKIGNLIEDINIGASKAFDKRMEFINSYIEKQRFIEKQTSLMLKTERIGKNTVAYYESIEKMCQYLLPLIQNKTALKITKNLKKNSLKLIFYDCIKIIIVCRPKEQYQRSKIKLVDFMKIKGEEKENVNENENNPVNENTKENEDKNENKSEKLPPSFTHNCKVMQKIIELSQDCLRENLSIESKFSNPYLNEFIFLSILAKISYAAHLFDSKISIQAVGGFIRSIILKEPTIHDLDLRSFFIGTHYLPEDFLNYLQKNHLIESYLRCNIENEYIYTLSINNIIISLRVLFEENYKADATANALSFKILWKDLNPHEVELHIPEFCQNFMRSIRQKKIPEYEIYPDFSCNRFLKNNNVQFNIKKLISKICKYPLSEIKNSICELENFDSFLGDKHKNWEKLLNKIIISILGLIADVKIIFKSLLRRDQNQFYFPGWLDKLLTCHVGKLLQLAAMVYSGNDKFRNLVYLSLHNYLYRKVESNTYLEFSAFLSLTSQVVSGLQESKMQKKLIYQVQISKISESPTYAKYYYELIKALEKKHPHTTSINILLILLNLSQISHQYQLVTPHHVDNLTYFFVLENQLIMLFKSKLQEMTKFYNCEIDIETIFNPVDKKSFDYKISFIKESLYHNWCIYQQQSSTNYYSCSIS